MKDAHYLYASVLYFSGITFTPFGDVALVFLAARLKTTHIFTIDRTDFNTYRTRAGKPFNRLWVNN